MLRIEVPISPERWDDEKQLFIFPETVALQLEHSLVSLHKWESKWCKSFISNPEKTEEEIIDYIKCMTITQNVDPDVYNHLTQDNIIAVNEYISAPMTATYFSEEKNGHNNREVITAELIYYWMISANIPFECRKWHLNSLLTLIRVCGVKNQPPKKRSRREILSRNAALNQARRKQYNTRG